MAQLFPSWEVIRQPPSRVTKGEQHLLSALQKHLDDSFEVYFQPLLNGDNPDIIVMRRGYGVLIIEVKDWQLAFYRVSRSRQWSLVKNDAPVKSPLSQAIDYKRNLYDLHIESLKEREITSPDLFDLVGCLVYFANEDSATIHERLRNYGFRPCGWVKGFGNFQVAGRGQATQEGIEGWVRLSGLLDPDERFDEALYQSFRRYLQPPFHPHQDGEPLNYPKKQAELIESRPGRQKVRGVAGSGKTMVLARRAVDAHKRTRSRVLILTYNITLRNYIHDKISKVREDFAWDNFLILHYHEFIRAMANNLGLPIRSLDEFNREDFFAPVSDQTPRFAAIFVDEVQDYQVEWLRSVYTYFLSDGGEFVLFGDEKQNIYGRDLDVDRRCKTNIPGRWNELTASFRLSDLIVRVATAFQNHFFNRKYDLDSIEIAPEQTSLFNAPSHFEYHDLSKATDGAEVIYELYRSVCQKHDIHPNDVCIISSRISFLREVDCLIRTRQGERTMTMFESKETYNELLERIEQDEELDDKVEGLRKAKKFHFWMNPGTVKFATIHSFKGWEINTLLLVLFSDQARGGKGDESKGDRVSDEELIYTAITRCRHNLIVANFGEPKYHDFFSRVAIPNEPMTVVR